MKASIIVVLTFIIACAFSNDVKKQTKEANYSYSDYVFIGKVDKVGIDDYMIEVYEVFKGSLGDSVKIVIEKNSISPRVNEVWLFYAIELNEEVFIPANNWSRNFNFPVNINSETLPGPLSPNANDFELWLSGEMIKQLALNELYSDISHLRHKNTTQNFTKLLEYGQIVRSLEESISKISILVKILIAIVLLNSIILVYKTFRVKGSGD